MKAFFISGTDTEVGKTVVSSCLLRVANSHKLTTIACKPVASGCNLLGDKLCNQDALALQQAASIEIAYDKVNPYAFEPSIAPHIAANLAKINIDLTNLINHCQQILSYQADITIIEGIGGWQVPINQKHTMADLIAAIKLPVILVVSIKLGCINHTLLTLRDIKSYGLKVIGWIANQSQLDKDNSSQHIITNLQRLINIPLLANIPYLDKHNFFPEKYFTNFDFMTN